MSKQIVKSEKLKHIALEVIKDVAGIVKSTLGPGGNPVMLQRTGNNPDGSPRGPVITKDGVSVAETIVYSDPIKNTIAQAVIQVAKNTVETSGDGTTSSLLLAEAVYAEGFKYIKQGQNNIQLFEALKEAKTFIIKRVKELSEEITEESVYNVAKISSNGDEEIAQIVTDAIKAVGEDGHISLEEGWTHETTLEIVEGAMYDKGYKSSHLGHLLVNNKAKDMCEMDETAVVLYNGRMADIEDVRNVLERAYSKDERGQIQAFPLLVIATDFADEVLNLFMQNRKQGNIPVAAIKVPSDGSPNSRTGILDDLSALTGAKVFARGLDELRDLEVEDLGGAERVEITANKTVIFGGKGDPEEIMQRVEDLKTLLSQTPYEFDKLNLRYRIGKLTGGIAVVRAGGNSEVEIIEKKDRIEDALCAAKVALKEGIVAGGGMTLMKIAEELTDNSPAHDILRAALKEAFNQIVRNVGENPEAIKTRMHYEKKEGYNARTKQLVSNMIEEGIIDPAKVTIDVVENAISIAGMLLTTGGAVVEEPTKTADFDMSGMDALKALIQ